MNRRRRASSIASRATDDEVENSSVENIRKKRRVDPVYVISNRQFYLIYIYICMCKIFILGVYYYVTDLFCR